MVFGAEPSFLAGKGQQLIRNCLILPRGLGTHTSKFFPQGKKRMGQNMKNLPCFMLERFWKLDREFGRK